MTVVPGSMTINALVRAYVGVLADENEAESQLTMQFLADHIADLIAATASIGAPATAHDNAGARGLRVARTQAILAKIRTGFTDPEISAKTVAASLGLSVRYVHELLEDTGLRFAEHVLELRLQLTRRILSNGGNDKLLVSEVAYSCGFSSLSYFNRAFRHRFGCTPGSAR